MSNCVFWFKQLPSLAGARAWLRLDIAGIKDAPVTATHRHTGDRSAIGTFDEGELVSIVGRFNRISLVGGLPKPRPFFIALASSIEVIDPGD